MGYYIWYSEEVTGRSPPRSLLAVPNVSTYPSTVSVPNSCHSIWYYHCLCTIKGYNNRCRTSRSGGSASRGHAHRHVFYYDIIVSAKNCAARHTTDRPTDKVTAQLQWVFGWNAKKLAVLVTNPILVYNETDGEGSARPQ